MFENPLAALARGTSHAPEKPRKVGKKARRAKPDLGDLTGEPGLIRDDVTDAPERGLVEAAEERIMGYIDGLDVRAREQGIGVPEWHHGDRDFQAEYFGEPQGLSEQIKRDEFNRLAGPIHSATREDIDAYQKHVKTTNSLFREFATAYPALSHDTAAISDAVQRVASGWEEEGLRPALLMDRVERDRSGFFDEVATEIATGQASYAPEGGADGRTIGTGANDYGHAAPGFPESEREGPGLGASLSEQQKKDGYV